MWGDQWSQMIWGQGHQVPALTFVAALIFGAALLVAGVWALRARRWVAGAAALALALVIPASASALTLPFSFTDGTVADANQVNANFAALANGRAYGFVTLAGTLDSSLRGINGVAQPFTSTYCFNLGLTPKNVVANVDPTTVGFPAVIMTTNRTLSSCPAGFGNAGAIIENASGTLANGGFYISFQ